MTRGPTLTFFTLTFFTVSAFLLAFGLWTAEQQFTQQDKINQEQHP